MTEQGGSASHAAVVARELGRPCVVGCGANTVTALVSQHVTLDGASGRVWAGNVAVAQTDEGSNDDLHKLIEWGASLIPIRLVKAEDVTAEVIDLDTFGEGWRGALRPGITVRGRILETEQGIRAAMAAHVEAAVVRYRMPAILACLQPAPAQDAASLSRVEKMASTADVSELSLLRLVSLKGRASFDILADSLSLPVDHVIAAYAPLFERGLCANMSNAVRLTPAGRDRMSLLLTDERMHLDPATMVALYEDFCIFNAELKQLMTAWQLRDDGERNEHNDADYDRAVLQRLADLHERARPLLERLAQLSPRLGHYYARLAHAAQRVAAGEHGYVAKIIADSYHTVWFELHEDLLSLAGLKRASEPRRSESGA
jgi:pyruvate,orthophosphate dikinase